MSQTSIGGWLPGAPWLPALLVAAPVLWAWWKENAFARVIVACAIWAGLLWLEVFLIGAPRMPGISVIFVNHLAKMVAVEGRNFSATLGIAFCAMFCVDWWLAWYASKFPRYWHKWRVPKRPWYLDFYESLERRL